ncbi:hypothetical protein HANVADRAFT_61082 [Hanseniaspora valbyensis NRRL Y-1626]|uniref:Uncharacterized protein n=1 Tax=Hanseniaspora valbyensis NRRL Y-1626 TaxID=766949 RepID=A0A1B7TIH9_9ASCO|nr:hypothetical protein HANVADRAFT_61082 [Hanseniaspora valbyensis NRRL Y-1626]
MERFHNITSSSDLIRQLQPILLQTKKSQSISLSGAIEDQGPSNSTTILTQQSDEDDDDDDDDEEEGDLTNIELLQEQNNFLGNGKIPIQVNVILEYILSYMEKQGKQNSSAIDFSNSYELISELEGDNVNVSKLQELLVLVTKIVKEQAEQINLGNSINNPSPQSARHSNLVLLDNISNSNLLSSKEGTLNPNNAIEQLTSLLVSECVKNNIILQSTQTGSANSYGLLENAIKELVQIVSSSSSNRKDINLSNGTPKLEKISTNDSASPELLALKLQDLQLAHDFLSEQFSKERLIYNNEVTIKERQLYNYKKANEDKDKEIESLKAQLQSLKSEMKEQKPVTPYSENDENINLLSSPGSITSNDSESINILRTEFKNKLNKIQDYYQAELEKLR